MEVRAVVVSVVQKFDIEMADGYDNEQWDKDLLDVYVVTGPSLFA